MTDTTGTEPTTPTDPTEPTEPTPTPEPTPEPTEERITFRDVYVVPLDEVDPGDGDFTLEDVIENLARRIDKLEAPGRIYSTNSPRIAVPANGVQQHYFAYPEGIFDGPASENTLTPIVSATFDPDGDEDELYCTIVSANKDEVVIAVHNKESRAIGGRIHLIAKPKG